MKIGKVDHCSNAPASTGSVFFSYGFRPFFLGAALFAGFAVPAWIVLLAGAGESATVSVARDWHVHEMVFGFLPAVITGFLLTAIPNWTDRPPIRGGALKLLFSLWLAGRQRPCRAATTNWESRPPILPERAPPGSCCAMKAVC